MNGAMPTPTKTVCTKSAAELEGGVRKQLWSKGIYSPAVFAQHKADEISFFFMWWVDTEICAAFGSLSPVGGRPDDLPRHHHRPVSAPPPDPPAVPALIAFPTSHRSSFHGMRYADNFPTTMLRGDRPVLFLQPCNQLAVDLAALRRKVGTFARGPRITDWDDAMMPLVVVWGAV